MPSPFPGMDPYIEMFEWEDFHTTFLTILREELTDKLPSGYAARVERRSYVELDVEYLPFEQDVPAVRTVIPDLAMTHAAKGSERDVKTAVAVLETAEPARQRLPQRIERRETYLEIRDLQSRRIITALEMISPANQRAGTEGGRLYAEKRLTVLSSQSHFVEIDLLRGGQRILLAEPGLPPDHDYYVFISRAEERPQIDLYSWRLKDPLPGIRIPLKPEHGHVPLDLSRALNLTYDRAGYQNTLDYRQPLVPPARPTDDAWLRSLLQSVTLASAM
jgi:hypothetical protein